MNLRPLIGHEMANGALQMNRSDQSEASVNCCQPAAFLVKAVLVFCLKTFFMIFLITTSFESSVALSQILLILHRQLDILVNDF